MTEEWRRAVEVFHSEDDLLRAVLTWAQAMPDLTFRQLLRLVMHERGRGPVETQGTVRPAVAKPQAITAEVERMRVLTVILLNHPDLITTVEHAYCSLDLPEGLDRLRDPLLWWACNVGPPLLADHAALHGHLIGSQRGPELEQALAASPVPMPRCVRPGAERSEALAGWWHIFGFLNLEGLGEEIRLAERLCRQDLTADNQNRLLALKAAFNRLREGEPQPVHLPSNDRGGFW